ncbi:MAG: sensor histidine kinase, partial [Bacteroidia bacterium]
KQLTLVYNEIERQKHLVEATLTEKEALLKEIHHRVKNNLQVISSLFELQSLRTDNREIKKAITEGQNRVKSMALIHQKLYQTDELKELPFTGYIKDLVKTLIQSYGKTEKDIKVEITSDPIRFNLDIAIPMGLITNELVSNSLKYAFVENINPCITIVLRELSDHNYLFKISDNGIGLPKDFDIDKLDSLGVKLIKTLARQIEAEWSLSGADGTVFIMKFNSKTL